MKRNDNLISFKQERHKLLLEEKDELQKFINDACKEAKRIEANYNKRKYIKFLEKVIQRIKISNERS